MIVDFYSNNTSNINTSQQMIVDFYSNNSLNHNGIPTITSKSTILSIRLLPQQRMSLLITLVPTLSEEVWFIPTIRIAVVITLLSNRCVSVVIQSPSLITSSLQLHYPTHGRLVQWLSSHPSKVGTRVRFSYRSRLLF